MLQPVPEENLMASGSNNNIENSNYNTINQEQNLSILQDNFKGNLVNMAQNESISEYIQNISQSMQQANLMLNNQLFSHYINQVITELCDVAITYLNNEEQGKTEQILRLCDQIIFESNYGEYSSLKSLILNNWGSFYRKVGDQQRALQIFKEALRIIQVSESEKYKGHIFLNLGALLSQQGNHNEAIDCSKSAAFYFNEEFQQMVSQSKGACTDESQNNNNIEQLQNNKQFLDLVSNLSISLYNVGSEEEFFKNYDLAMINYENACEIAENNLGQDNFLTQKLIAFRNDKRKEFKSLDKKSPQKEIRRRIKQQQQQQKLIKNKKQQKEINIRLNPQLLKQFPQQIGGRNQTRQQVQQKIQNQDPSFEEKIQKYQRKQQKQQQQQQQKMPSLLRNKKNDKNFQQFGNNNSGFNSLVMDSSQYQNNDSNNISNSNDHYGGNNRYYLNNNNNENNNYNIKNYSSLSNNNSRHFLRQQSLSSISQKQQQLQQQQQRNNLKANTQLSRTSSQAKIIQSQSQQKIVQSDDTTFHLNLRKNKPFYNNFVRNLINSPYNQDLNRQKLIVIKPKSVKSSNSKEKNNSNNESSHIYLKNYNLNNTLRNDSINEQQQSQQRPLSAAASHYFYKRQMEKLNNQYKDQSKYDYESKYFNNALQERMQYILEQEQQHQNQKEWNPFDDIQKSNMKNSASQGNFYDSLQQQQQQQQKQQQDLSKQNTRRSQKQQDDNNNLRDNNYRGSQLVPNVNQPVQNSKKCGTMFVQTSQQQLQQVGSRQRLEVDSNEFRVTNRLFPDNYMCIQQPKIINLPETYDSTSLKKGYLFVGFEKNMHILVFYFAKSVEGKTYRDHKDFCKHMVNISEIMDIWNHNSKQREFKLTLEQLCTQIQGKLLVNVRDKELEVQESIKQVFVVTVNEEQRDLDFIRYGTKNSKIEKTKDVSLEYLIKKEKAVLGSQRQKLYLNMEQQIVDGALGYLCAYQEEYSLYFGFRVYMPDLHNNKWSKFEYSHRVDMEAVYQFYNYQVDQLMVEQLVDSFNGLWELDYDSRALHFLSNQFSYMKQEISEQNDSYHKITQIKIEKQDMKRSYLKIQFKNQRRPSIIKMAEEISQESLIQFSQYGLLKMRQQWMNEEEALRQQQITEQMEKEYEMEQEEIQREQEFEKQRMEALMRQQKELREKNQSATTIQVKFRYKRKKELEREREMLRKNRAAEKIQARYKGKKQFEEYQEMLYIRSQAGAVIYKFIKKRREKRMRQLQFMASFRIQRYYKKYRKRQELRKLLKEAIAQQYVTHFAYTKIIQKQYVLYTVIERLNPNFQNENDYNNQEENGNYGQENKFYAQFFTLSEVEADKRLSKQIFLKKHLANDIIKDKEPWKFFDIFPDQQKVMFRKQVIKLQGGIQEHTKKFDFCLARDNNIDVYFGQILDKTKRVKAQVKLEEEEARDLIARPRLEDYLIYSLTKNKVMYIKEEKQKVVTEFQRLVRAFLDRQNIRKQVFRYHIKIYFCKKYYFDENLYLFYIMSDLEGVYSVKVMNIQRLRLNKKIRLRYKLDKEFALDEKIWENYLEEFYVNIPNKILKLHKFFPKEQVNATLRIQNFYMAWRQQQIQRYNHKRFVLFDFLFQNLQDIQFIYWVKIYRVFNRKYAFCGFIPLNLSLVGQRKKLVLTNNNNQNNKNGNNKINTNENNLSIDDSPISKGSNQQSNQEQYRLNTEEEQNVDSIVQEIQQQDKQLYLEYFQDKENRWGKKISLSENMYEYFMSMSYSLKEKRQQREFRVQEYFDIDRHQDIFEVKQEKQEEIQKMFSQKQYTHDYRVLMNEDFMQDKRKYNLQMVQKPQQRYISAQVSNIKKNGWSAITDVPISVYNAMKEDLELENFDPLYYFQVEEENNILEIKNTEALTSRMQNSYHNNSMNRVQTQDQGIQFNSLQDRVKGQQNNNNNDDDDEEYEDEDYEIEDDNQNQKNRKEQQMIDDDQKYKSDDLVLIDQINNEKNDEVIEIFLEKSSDQIKIQSNFNQYYTLDIPYEIDYLYIQYRESKQWSSVKELLRDYLQDNYSIEKNMDFSENLLVQKKNQDQNSNNNKILNQDQLDYNEDQDYDNEDYYPQNQKINPYIHRLQQEQQISVITEEENSHLENSNSINSNNNHTKTQQSPCSSKQQQNSNSSSRQQGNSLYNNKNDNDSMAVQNTDNILQEESQNFVILEFGSNGYQIRVWNNGDENQVEFKVNEDSQQKNIKDFVVSKESIVVNEELLEQEQIKEELSQYIIDNFNLSSVHIENNALIIFNKKQQEKASVIQEIFKKERFIKETLFDIMVGNDQKEQQKSIQVRGEITKKYQRNYYVKLYQDGRLADQVEIYYNNNQDQNQRQFRDTKFVKQFQLILPCYVEVVQKLQMVQFTDKEEVVRHIQDEDEQLLSINVLQQ